MLASLLMYLSFSVYDLVTVSAYMGWIPLFIAVTLVEPPRQKMGKEHKENFKMIYRVLFKESKLIFYIILVFLAFSLSFSYLDHFQLYPLFIRGRYVRV